MAISARAEEVGDDFGEIDAKVEGEDAKVAFNSKYLTDLLSVVGKGDMILEMNDSSKPASFAPSAKSTSSTSSCPCTSNGEELSDVTGVPGICLAPGQ